MGDLRFPTDGRSYTLLFPTLKGIDDGQDRLECVNHTDRARTIVWIVAVGISGETQVTSEEMDRPKGVQVGFFFI